MRFRPIELLLHFVAAFVAGALVFKLLYRFLSWVL